MHLKDICQVSPEKYSTWPQKGFELLIHTAAFPQCSHPQPSPLDTLGDGEAWTRKSSMFLRISHLQVLSINFIERGRPCHNQLRGTCTGMWRWRTTVISSLWVTLSAFIYLIKYHPEHLPQSSLLSPPWHIYTHTALSKTCTKWSCSFVYFIFVMSEDSRLWENCSVFLAAPYLTLRPVLGTHCMEALNG